MKAREGCSGRDAVVAAARPPAVPPAARLLGRLLAATDESADLVRAARVEGLRLAVARGEYRVDVDRTARALLAALAGVRPG